MKKRTLVLRAESLTELLDADLGSIAGAASQPGNTCACPSYSWYCVTGGAICGDSRIICS
jgi:hypothetical protein